MTIYWTKETSLGFVAMTADGFLFLDRKGEVVCQGSVESLAVIFNKLRKKGDKLHVGPPPPPAPGDDASTEELDEWITEMEEAVVSNSLDDSDENL